MGSLNQQGLEIELERQQLIATGIFSMWTKR